MRNFYHNVILLGLLFFNLANISKAQETFTCTAEGKILREVWNTSGSLESFDFTQKPSRNEYLNKFASGLDEGDNYMSRIRGYICPPQTGKYVFWVSSDDDSELWLSTDSTSENKVKIAYLTTWTSVNEWNKEPNQESDTILLVQGQKYYIELLHHEGGGGDHAEAGWRLPDATMDRPISGTFLSPIEKINITPTAKITIPSADTVYTLGATINLVAEATDVNDTIKKVEFYKDGILVGEDILRPYTFTWVDAPVGVHNFTVLAYDSSSVSVLSRPLTITVFDENLVEVVCDGTGLITREEYKDFTGDFNLLSSQLKTDSANINIFEGPQDLPYAYTSRIRGYVCAPFTGNYYFFIASDDQSELWISTDATPENKTKIASVDAWTGYREWNKFPSQKSGAIALTAGEKYYIEAIQRETTGGDNLSVGWQLPNGSLERPILGNRLFPFYIIEDVVTSTKTSNTQLFSFYPSPANDKITVNLFSGKNESATINVYDVLSKPVLNKVIQSGQNTIQINVSDLESGVYTISVSQGNSFSIERIVISK